MVHPVEDMTTKLRETLPSNNNNLGGSSKLVKRGLLKFNVSMSPKSLLVFAQAENGHRCLRSLKPSVRIPASEHLNFPYFLQLRADDELEDLRISVYFLQFCELFAGSFYRS